MATIYLIDGTNAVRRLYQESHRVSLDEEYLHMDSFVEWLTWMAARHQGRASFKLAFDGPPRAFSSPRTAGLDFYFGKEEGADHVLLDLARFLCHAGKSVVLVTADRALSELAHREGAASVRPEEFYRKLGGGPTIR